MLNTISYYLVIVGGVNYGLVGLGNLMDQDWDLLGLILGYAPVLQDIVYLIIGVAAVVMIVDNVKNRNS